MGEWSLESHYDALWEGALARFARGEVELDPHLLRIDADGRRGMTVAIRPGPEVAGAVARLAEELRAIEPGQHYYAASELHVTALSLFTASERFSEEHAPRAAAYRAAVTAALERAAPFAIRFCGVSASPGAIMVQGFPDGEGLEHLRGRLRAELTAAGLGEGLDQRYRMRTAHMTIMRFREPPRDLAALVERLRAARGEDFGTAQVRAAQLVEHNWYMSERHVRLLREHALEPRHG